MFYVKWRNQAQCLHRKMHRLINLYNNRFLLLDEYEKRQAEDEFPKLQNKK